MKPPVQKRRRESGQAVLLVIVGMSIFLLGALGLAIDASQLYAQRQMAQAAADAAAQGAISSIYHGTNATAGSPFGTGSSPSAFTCSTSDGTTPCAYARLNGFGGTSGDSVAVSFPTSVSGVTLASGTAPAVTVSVRRTVNTTLMRLFGPASSSIQASATAALVTSAFANCITTLDPLAGMAISGNANLNIPNCSIAIDSSSPTALAANGNIKITARSINVVGGDVLVGNVSVSPSPTTGASSVSDPLASVAAPSFDSTHCDYTNYSLSGNNSVTLSPGVYCGGMSFSGNTTVNFNPGTYVLLGGGISASGNQTLTGSGVTFYNTYNASHTYAPFALSGNVSETLTAPSSGALAGMLFFQDRSVAALSSESISGNASSKLTGALYFPRSVMNYSGNSSSTNQNIIIVADSINYSGNASLNYDPTQPGAPVQMKYALVQ